MKRLIALALTAFMSIGFLTGCGLVKIEGKTEETETEKVEQPKLEDTLENAFAEFTVHGIQAFSWENRYFLLVDMTYVSRNMEETSELKLNYFYAFADNEELVRRQYKDLTTTYTEGRINPLDYVINPYLLYSDSVIQPGRTERGYLLYEYYRPFSEFELQVGSFHVFATAKDIQVLDAGAIVLEATAPEPEPTIEETDVVDAESPTEEPVPEETTPPETVPEETTPPETAPVETAAEEPVPEAA